MAEIVKITCGQPFVVYLPLVILNADGSKEAVDASTLTDVVVKLQAQGMDDVTVTTEAYERYLVLNIPGTMPVAEYNIIVSATLSSGRPFTLRMSHALGVMAWDWQTNWRDYLVGEHIELCDQPFIAGEFTTDAEYEALKQQLREQIVAAEQAEEEAIAEKERYAEALEHLDDIAQETSVEGIADSIGTPATGQPSTLFAAIAAGGGGGGGGDAQESTSQAILAAVQGGNVTAIAELLNNAHGLDALRTLIAAIPTTAPATPQNVIDAKDAVIAAMPSVSGLATEANATVNKQAILNALTAAETALQGGDQTATLTALKQAVAAIVIPTDYAKETTAQQAATDAAAAKTAAQSLTSLDSDINAGKAAIAAAITQKGVSTSANEALVSMAGKVSNIQQETIEIDGGDMYAEQLCGVPSNATSPGYWNLYEVMAYLLSKTSTEQYSILLCEIPNSGTQYAFGTAIDPGAVPAGFVYSDDWQLGGAGTLNIHVNTESGHTWDDDLDMKGNRWIAWLFPQVIEGGIAPTITLGAAGTNCPQPSSIHIGRHIGGITASANGSVTEVVVTEGNELDFFYTSTYTQKFTKRIVTRNISSQSGALVYNSSNIEGFYIADSNITGKVIDSSGANLSSIIFENCSLDYTSFYGGAYNNLKSVIFSKCNGRFQNTVAGNLPAMELQILAIIDCDEFIFSGRPYAVSVVIKHIYIGANIELDKTKYIKLDNAGERPTSFNPYYSTEVVELSNGFCKCIDINRCNELTESSIYTYVLQRLRQDEAGCGSGVTIALGSINLAKLTSTDTVALLDSLTNTYGYTFA